MKKAKVFVMVLFIICLFKVDNASAQAQKISDYNVEAYLTKNIKDKAGNVIGVDTVFTLTDGIEQVIVTPIGNYLRTLTFKIDQDEPIMELANPFAFLRVRAEGDFDNNGEVEVLVDQFSVLTKSGNLKLVYHYY